MSLFNKKSKKDINIQPQASPLREKKYIYCEKKHHFDIGKYNQCPYCDNTIKGCECGLFYDTKLYSHCPLCENDSNDSGFLKFAHMKRRYEKLPENVQVFLNSTPNGGVFSIMLSGLNGNGCEIHECDEKGESIFRTYGFTK